MNVGELDKIHPLYELKNRQLYASVLVTITILSCWYLNIPLFSFIMASITSSIGSVFNGIGNIFSGLLESIFAIFSHAWSLVIGILATAWSAVEGVVNAALHTVSGILSTVTHVFGDLIGIVTSEYDAWLEWMHGLIVVHGGKVDGKGIVTGFSGVATTIVKMTSVAICQSANTLSETWTEMIDTIHESSLPEIITFAANIVPFALVGAGVVLAIVFAGKSGSSPAASVKKTTKSGGRRKKA